MAMEGEDPESMLALSLSWEEVSECQNKPGSSSSSSSEDASTSSSFVGSFVEAFDDNEDDENTIGHQWDVVSLSLCDDIESLSGHSMVWTYRDALLLSANHPQQRVTMTGPSRFATPTTRTTMRDPTIPKKNTKYVVQTEALNDEMNEHLLDYDGTGKPMSEKLRRKYERFGRRRIVVRGPGTSEGQQSNGLRESESKKLSEKVGVESKNVMDSGKLIATPIKKAGFIWKPTNDDSEGSPLTVNKYQPAAVKNMVEHSYTQLVKLHTKNVGYAPRRNSGRDETTAQQERRDLRVRALQDKIEEELSKH